MRLSVVIPTHERAGLLEHNLAAIAAQSLPRDQFEVIVVDDGSSEPTRAHLRSLGAKFELQLLEKPQGGLASARNHGASQASGDILLFLDDDVEPAPGAFAAHLAAHDRAATEVVVLGSLPYPPDLQLDCFLWYLEATSHFDLYKDPVKYPGGRPPLPPLNGNSSLPRSLFERIGRYDEDFRSYGGEDLELGHRLAQAGIEFVYAPDAIGYHHHSKGFDRFIVDQERSGEAVARIWRRYPEIKRGKKIDLLVDSYGSLSMSRRLQKLLLGIVLALRPLLVIPRAMCHALGRFLVLRHLLYPCYRLVGHAHYAIGMRRELARGAPAVEAAS